jgi:Lsr2
MVREFLYRDDLDGTTENVRNLTYTLEGQDYEIDLSEDNVQRFYSALEPFVAKSRQVKRHASTAPARRRGGDGRRSGGSGRDDIPDVRAWAQANGFDVSERGRIKKEILDKYDEAHQ